MKKKTRSQKRIMIERGKTIIIVLLCACCVFFLVQLVDLYSIKYEENDNIWANTASQYAGESGPESVVSSYRKMLEPQMITVGCETGKYVCRYSDEEYDVLNGITEESIRILYLSSGNDIKQVGMDAWEKAFEGEFVFVKYPCVRVTDFEKRFLSLAESGFSDVVQAYSEILTVMDENNINIYVRNYGSEDVFCVQAPQQFQSINEVIKKISADDKKNYVFAHELNLDKTAGNGTVLNSMFMLPIGDITANKVISRVPTTYREGIDFVNTTEFTVNLLNAFGFNPNTIRQYSDSEGKLIYVGEKGTLRVSPDGQIEYKALTDEDGIDINAADGSVSDAYSIVGGITSMNQSVLRISGIGNEKNNASLKFVDFPDLRNSSEVKVAMDYFVDSHRVFTGPTPAVEALIKKGVLVEYKIMIKAIERTNKQESCGDIMKAIDEFCLNNTECNRINEGLVVYRINQDDVETPAVWDIKGE